MKNRMKFLKQKKLLIATLFLISPFAANADLIGDDIDINVYHGFGIPGAGGSCHSFQAVDREVGAGAELSLADEVSGVCSGAIGVDIDESTILFSGIEGVANGQRGANFPWILAELLDLDWLGMAGSITGVSLVSQDLFSRADSRFDPIPLISFTGDSISILWDARDLAVGGQVSILSGGTALFSYTTSHVAVAVPEPGSLALLGLGLVGLGLARRRRKV